MEDCPMIRKPRRTKSQVIDQNFHVTCYAGNVALLAAVFCCATLPPPYATKFVVGEGKRSFQHNKKLLLVDLRWWWNLAPQTGSTCPVIFVARQLPRKCCPYLLASIFPRVVSYRACFKRFSSSRKLRGARKKKAIRELFPDFLHFDE